MFTTKNSLSKILLGFLLLQGASCTDLSRPFMEVFSEIVKSGRIPKDEDEFHRHFKLTYNNDDVLLIQARCKMDNYYVIFRDPMTIVNYPMHIMDTMPEGEFDYKTRSGKKLSDTEVEQMLGRIPKKALGLNSKYNLHHRFVKDYPAHGPEDEESFLYCVYRWNDD